MTFRVGFGYDVHVLKEGQDFFLGGIQIEHTKGAVGHSDADVLIHAICDALLGAANLGDIGKHFPDTNEAYKDIDSKKLLAEVVKKLSSEGYTISNIDSTVCLQQPKIADYIEQMKTALAGAASLDVSLISVKATTTELLGFVGKGEGVSAYAIVGITKN